MKTNISSDESAITNSDVQWRIKSSEGEGLVWLIWEGKGRKLALNLGSKREARTVLADWLHASGGDSGRRSSAPDSWDSW